MILSFFLFFCIIYLLSTFVQANPIPVYPDPKPTFEPDTIVSHIQDGNFILWLLLIWFLDIALNTLFLYGGFLLLVWFHLKSEGWFHLLSRKHMIAFVVLLSSAGILSEWLLGSWIGGIVVVALVVFFSVLFLSKLLFNLDTRCSLFLAMYLLMVNLIIWAVIFSV
jgi:hypothetical protein